MESPLPLSECPVENIVFDPRIKKTITSSRRIISYDVIPLKYKSPVSNLTQELIFQGVEMESERGIRTYLRNGYLKYEMRSEPFNNRGFIRKWTNVCYDGINNFGSGARLTPIIDIKLVYPPIIGSVFTDLENKQIPWILLTGAYIRFIPILRVRQILIYPNGLPCLRMEIVSATVTHISR